MRAAILNEYHFSCSQRATAPTKTNSRNPAIIEQVTVKAIQNSNIIFIIGHNFKTKIIK